jgi:hypothetical protein
MTTYVLLGGGPSLTRLDVDLVKQHRDRGRCAVIAINDAYRLAPWADALYACDQKWWTWHGGVPGFAGPKYGMGSACEPITQAGVTVMRNTGPCGLELEPGGLRAGSNSGYQALNLAVQWGARMILLLGFDMCADGGRTHWFGDHPDGQLQPFDGMRRAFDTILEPLAELKVSVVNCSRRTALEAFPIRPLADALAALTTEAA